MHALKSPLKFGLAQYFPNTFYQKTTFRARFGNTYIKIEMIERRLVWSLCKDDTQICEAFHIKNKQTKKETIFSSKTFL